MEKIKKNFGFGCMRLPMQGEEVDLNEMKRMVDAFLAAGFNYFDTAHGYLQGKSEQALKPVLTDRYPRESYVLTDKLTNVYFKSEADIRPFFESQLETLGVDYLDFYLMHAQSKEIFAHFKKCHAYETAFALKAEGKIRHVGISFHDTPEVLEQILTEYPEIEIVQIQFNYVDYENPTVQSRQCYEVCRKHNKPVIVMEPVKGGNLVNLPEEAKAVLEGLHNGSPASYTTSIKYPVLAGGIAVRQESTGSVKAMMQLMPLKIDKVGAASVLSGNERYEMADNVQVYLWYKGQYYPTKLAQVDADGYHLTGWYDNFGCAAGKKVRVIIAVKND